MEIHSDQVAVITGAAGGLGLALARRCAARGLSLVLADVDRDGLEAARRALGDSAPCETRPTDVSRAEEVEALAETAFRRFGRVHLLFNNAGVGLAAPVAETSENDWRWVLGVNLWGVIHGLAAFLPRLGAQGFESRIVNTASAAGFLSEPGMAAYSASKHAVVALSETLHRELAEAASRVGVTVLCPAFFPSGITGSERSRPPELARRGPPSAAALAAEARMEKAVRSGRLGADEIAGMALAAVEAGDLHAFTHKRIRLAIEERMRRVLAACPFPEPG
jgi:NAD(P)-dependent dehydrogenase (short-subunit alcohol dehydrogenase family)